MPQVLKRPSSVTVDGAPDLTKAAAGSRPGHGGSAPAASPPAGFRKSSRSGRRPGRLCARFSRFLPALVALAGVVILFAAGPAVAQSSDSTLRALTVEVSTDGVNFSRVGIVPEFSASHPSYETVVRASERHTHMRVTATANHAGATLKVGKNVGGRFPGQTSATSGSPSEAIALADGGNQIRIRVTAQDRSSQDYVVTVYRGGRQGPAPPRYVKVTAGTAKLTLTWTAPAHWGSFPAGGYEVDWYAGASPPMDDSDWNLATPTPSPLAATATSYEFTGTYGTHTVADGTTYQLRIRSLSTNPDDSSDHLVSDWTAPQAGTPPSGSSRSTDARLRGLTAGSATSATGTFQALTLTPSAFSASTTEYAASVANDRTHVKLTPTVNETNATVQVGKGSALSPVTSGTASGAIALDVGANAITVRVTAHDGSTMKDYTVTVTRAAQQTRSTNANLSALTVGSAASSGGQYTDFSIGTFGATTTDYTASVANDQTHVKVTPTVADTGKATVGVRKGSTGNFSSVTSGQASGAIALDVGANTITVRVTAEDTTTMKDYTVTVTRRVTAPSVPRNVQATPGDAKLTLTWQAPASWGTWPAGGFELQHNLATGWNDVDSAHHDAGDPTLTRSVFQGAHNSRAVTNGSAVSLRIRARAQQPGTDGSQDSHFRYSAWVTVTGTPQAATVAPGAVGSLTATPGDGKFDLAWTAPAGEVTHYEIHRTTATTTSVANGAAALGSGTPSQGWIAYTDRVRRTSFSATGSNGTAYRVRVRAANSAGNGPWSFVTVTPAVTTGPVAQWARSSVTVRETDADRRVRLDIILSEALTDAVALSVSQTSGTATSGADWETLSDAACVTGASGDTSLSCTIVIKGDDASETDETMDLTLARTSGTVTVGTRSVIAVTIEDDETPAAPTGLIITPGDGTLALSWTAPTGTLTGYDVHYTSALVGAVADDAVASGTDASAAWVAATRTATDTTASQTISGLANNTEYRVRVRARNAAGAGAWVHGTGTPQQTDTTGPSAPTFVPGDGATVADAGTTITLTFTEAVRKDAANADFTGHADLSAILTLARTNAGGAAIAYTASINAGKTVITIDPTGDLADGAVYVGISSAYYDANGNAGTAASATFTVAATPARSSNADLGALAASTSTSARGTFTPLDIGTFSAGATSYTASVAHARTHVKVTATVADTGKATVGVRKGASGGFTPVTSGSASAAMALDVGSNAFTVRVTAEDSTTRDYTVTVTRQARVVPTVTLSASPNPVPEGQSVTISATLSSPAPRAMTFPVTVTRGTAEAQDLGTLPTRVRIAGGRTSGAVRIATRQDDDPDDETFTVALDTATLPSGVTAGTVTSVTVTIDDDDTPTVSLSVSPRNPVGAGESVEVTATLSSTLPGAVTIPLALIPDQGTTSADYRTLASITIAAGADSGTGTLVTVRDNDREYESVRVALDTANLPAEVGRGPRWWVRVTIAPEYVPVVSLEAPDTVDEGEAVTVTARLDEALSEAVRIPVTARFGNGPAESHEIPIAAGATRGTLAIATPYDDDSAHDALFVAIDRRILPAVEPEVRVWAYSRRYPNKVLISVLDRPALSSGRATAQEGRDGAAVFTVRLSYVAIDTVTVNYATADAAGAWQGAAPATAGADYTGVSGTLTFAVGQMEKTVPVPVLDDAVDEGTEHFLLRLSNPRGAWLKPGHGEAHGIITNDDPLQKMWLARFGRTVGSQVTDAVSERLAGGLTPGAHMTLAGQPLDLGKADDSKALAAAMTGLAQRFDTPDAPANPGSGPGQAGAGPFGRHGLSGPQSGPGGAWDGPGSETSAPARGVTGRALPLGSSFHVAGGGEGSGPVLAAWGRVAHAGFDGKEASDGGHTGIDGTVLTGTLGADADWGRVLAGVAVSLSEGEGGFEQTGVDSGSIESTLTTVSPYARLKVSERLSAWGLVGWGTGDMTITQDAREATGTRPARAETVTRTDISMQLGAIGARGALMEQDASGGMDLVLKTDAFFVRMESDRAQNSAATTADASRVRLVLEGGRSFAVGPDARFRPSLELGVRHDGGDAETGTGLEIGGGVRYADAASGLSVEARARMLAAHADSNYEEWGASATARLDPGERGRGLSLSLSPTIGSAGSATDRLWGAHDAHGFAPGGEFEAARGLRAEAGYGLSLLGDRFTGTPNLGFGLADGGARDYRIGWRLIPALVDGSGFEVSLDATRREAANDDAPAHGVTLRVLIRW